MTARVSAMTNNIDTMSNASWQTADSAHAMVCLFVFVHFEICLFLFQLARQLGGGNYFPTAFSRNLMLSQQMHVNDLKLANNVFERPAVATNDIE
jgi:hypothetical protein